MHFSDVAVDDRYDRINTTPQRGVAFTPSGSVRVPTERDYDRLIDQVGRRYGVHPSLCVDIATTNYTDSACITSGFNF